jgi:tetratricopeptide (TPR) repeat protein
MNRKSVFFLINLLLTFALTTTNYAFFKNDVDKAKDFMKANMNQQAIELLNKRINDKPTDAEAHFQLGICYVSQGNYSQAIKRFDSAIKVDSDYTRKVATEYKKAGSSALSQGSIGQARIFFEKAVQLNPKYDHEIGEQCREAADSALNKGSLKEADFLFQESVRYDSRFRDQGYSFYRNLGDRASGSSAEVFYKKSLDYTEDDQLRREVGFKLLRMAAQEWPGSHCESLKKQAAAMVGQNKVDEVFPKPYVRTTFEKSYSFEDAYNKEYGKIYVIEYNEDDIAIGDYIEVEARLIGGDRFTGKEVGISRGKDSKPQWITTKNGYFREQVERIPDAKYYEISLGGRKDLEVTVRVKRQVSPRPNLAAIEALED